MEMFDSSNEEENEPAQVATHRVSAFDFTFPSILILQNGSMGSL
jgi:hypothetical protein